jgi:pterin-4a-carbinolamine dehydratase
MALIAVQKIDLRNNKREVIKFSTEQQQQKINSTRHFPKYEQSLEFLISDIIPTLK